MNGRVDDIGVGKMPRGYNHGDVNAYHCERCGRYTVTVNRDEGATPMFLSCRQEISRMGEDLEVCGGKGVSLMYPDPAVWPEGVPSEPEYEWYMPEEVERKSQPPEVRDHYGRGGLEIRRIGETEPSRIPGRRMMTRKERRQTRRNTRKRGRGYTK